MWGEANRTENTARAQKEVLKDQTDQRGLAIHPHHNPPQIPPKGKTDRLQEPVAASSPSE